MVFQGEDNLCGVLKVLDRGVGREEMVPDEEHEFQEGLELEFPATDLALGVFA